MTADHSDYETLNTPEDVVAASEAGKDILVRCVYEREFSSAIFTRKEDFGYIDWNMQTWGAEYCAAPDSDRGETK